MSRAVGSLRIRYVPTRTLFLRASSRGAAAPGSSAFGKITYIDTLVKLTLTNIYGSNLAKLS